MITFMIKYKDVPNSSIKLMLFPFYIEGAARIWLEKEPPHSILTWEDLVSKFINQFFPPSKPTNLRNEITNFQQKFEETFSEAWDRFKDLLRACPHHSFMELHQLDTFYNALNPTDQDSLNVAAGGNLLTKTPRDALIIIENKSKVCNSRNKPVVSKVSANTSSSTTACPSEMVALTDVVNVMLGHVKTSSPETVKAIYESYVTCGGPHPYYECLATDGNTFNASAATTTYNQNQGYRPQGDPNYRAINQMGPPGFPPVQNNQNRFNQNHGYNQNRGNNFNQGNQNYQASPQVGPLNDLSSYMKTNEVNMRVMQNQMNTASSSGLGSLPSNTVANPRGDLKAITTRSGISYDGPPIPPLPKVVEREPELSFADDLLHMPKFASMFKSLLNNKKKLFDLAKTPVNENCSAVILKKLPEKLGDPGKFLIPCDFPEIVECLALADLSASINSMPLSIWKKLLLPELTPTRMILELADRSTTSPSGIVKHVFVKVGKFHFPADFIVVDYVVDPRVPLILGRPFLRTTRALIDIYGEELTLRVDDEAITFKVVCSRSARFSNSSTSGNPTLSLDHILSTSFPSLTPFEGGDFILEEIKAWLTNDLTPSGIDDADFNPEGDLLLLKKLLNDDPSSPLPPKELHFEEIKTIKSSIDDPPELELKDLPSALEYAFLEVTNKLPVIISKELKDEEKAALLKLNDATRKDHFPLPFIDQMLKRLAGSEYYCFLDGISGYFQIPIDPEDQEKNTFTCPYGTFAYRCMPFGLCDAPGMFQRCMMAIFHDMIKETMEVFMDDFSVFGDSFSSFLSHLDKC
ncbi:reverse transcriptase domain-containing protein [Tanacetum coccineum]